MKYRKRQNLVLSIILHALLLLVVYIFQGAIFPYLRLGGLVPLLLPIVVTGIALYEGRDVGGVFGLFAGILCDVSFNQPVGTLTLVLTLVGICIGLISETILLSSFSSYYLCCAGVLIICAFVQMTPILALQNGPPTGYLIGIATAQTIYSLVLAIPLWFLIRALSRLAERRSYITGRR